MRLIPLALAALLAGGGPVFAQPAAAMAPAEAEFYVPTDAFGYLALASACDEFEMQTARLALSRSQSSVVQAYARGVLASRAASQRTLYDRANRGGLRPPAPQLTGEMIRRFDALANVAAPEFDAAYKAEQLAILRQGETTHRRFAEVGENAILREAAASLAAAYAGRLSAAEALPTN